MLPLFCLSVAVAQKGSSSTDTVFMDSVLYGKFVPVFLCVCVCVYVRVRSESR